MAHECASEDDLVTTRDAALTSASPVGWSQGTPAGFLLNA